MYTAIKNCTNCVKTYCENGYMFFAKDCNDVQFDLVPCTLFLSFLEKCSLFAGRFPGNN